MGDLDANLGALLKPDRSDWEKVKTALELAASLSGSPAVALAVKVVAFGHGWLFDGKKPDRVLPVLLDLKERIEKLEADQKEYLRTDAAQALFEDASARIGDQPDEPRRQDMQRILYKILERPRDPTENSLFLRLADELPAPALKLLNAAHAKVDAYHLVPTEQALAESAGLQPNEAAEWLRFLVNQGLLDQEQLGTRQYMDYEKVLSRLGRTFAEYRRS